MVNNVILTFSVTGGYILSKVFKSNLYTTDPKLQKIRLFRGVFGVFYAFQNLVMVKMPIQKSAVLFNTNSIFTVILGAIFLGEKPSVVIIVLLFTSTIGILLLINPSMLGWPVKEEQYFPDCKIFPKKIQILTKF